MYMGKQNSPEGLYRSPLLQHEVFEEPNPGLRIYSADLLQRRRFIFRFLSTPCGTVRGQQLWSGIANFIKRITQKVRWDTAQA
jgi:hypothetical protein